MGKMPDISTADVDIGGGDKIGMEEPILLLRCLCRVNHPLVYPRHILIVMDTGAGSAVFTLGYDFSEVSVSPAMSDLVAGRVMRGERRGGSSAGSTFRVI